MIDHVTTKTVRIVPSRTGTRSGFPGRTSGETPDAVWFPLLASVVLLAVVVAVHWSVWDAFAAELRKNAPVAVPLVAVLAVTVLVPPVAWAISAI